MFIVNPLTGGGLMKLFSTHPPMEERDRAPRGDGLRSSRRALTRPGTVIYVSVT